MVGEATIQKKPALSEKYTIPNLKKSVAVLNLLADQKEGISLADISVQLEIPKTTALRILCTLTSEGMVDHRGNKFYIGLRLIQLGMRVASKMEIRQVAVPFLAAITEKTGEASHIAVLSQDKALIIECVESPHPVKTSSKAGTLVDLYCSAIGKVLLAFGTGVNLNSLYPQWPLPKRTQRTCNTPLLLEKSLQIVHTQGYALDNEEYYRNVRCIAAPVFDVHGQVVAAIGITATVFRFKLNLVKDYARLLKDAAQEISKTFGA